MNDENGSMLISERTAPHDRPGEVFLSGPTPRVRSAQTHRKIRRRQRRREKQRWSKEADCTLATGLGLPTRAARADSA